MIVADTSAFAAIVFREDDADRFSQALEDHSEVFVAAPTAFELRLVVARKLGFEHLPEVDMLLGLPQVEVVDWESEFVPIATEALRLFGGRPAQLNFGDCMTYALTKSLSAPLLYKGNDFAATDIRSALDA